jgi:DNA repair protein SbcD/Mre11
VKLLHTGDWHLGKVLKGIARIDEQRAVMAEMVSVVEREQIDIVLVAGDVFDVSAPSPDAQALAWSTLLAFRSAGAEVIVIGGNHDSPDALDALRPLFSAAGVTMAGRVRSPGDGGVVSLTTRSGEATVVSLLPFVSQRAIVRAADVFGLDGATTQGRYADRLATLIEALTAPFRADAVNVVLAHATVTGALFGGGERESQSIFDYHLPALAFPPSASYVALGHLHRTQKVPGPCPIWYPGSPIAVDFGEGDNRGAVLLIEASPGRPAKVDTVELASARRLVTLTGTVPDLSTASIADDALVRVIVTEPARTGLADEVRAAVASVNASATVAEVRVQRSDQPRVTGDQRVSSGRSSTELFHDYLADAGVNDTDVERLFAQLLADETGTAEPADGPQGALF